MDRDSGELLTDDYVLMQIPVPKCLVSKFEEIMDGDDYSIIVSNDWEAPNHVVRHSEVNTASTLVIKVLGSDCSYEWFS